MNTWEIIQVFIHFSEEKHNNMKDKIPADSSQKMFYHFYVDEDDTHFFVSSYVI